MRGQLDAFTAVILGLHQPSQLVVILVTSGNPEKLRPKQKRLFRYLWVSVLVARRWRRRDAAPTSGSLASAEDDVKKLFWIYLTELVSERCQCADRYLVGGQSGPRFAM